MHEYIDRKYFDYSLIAINIITIAQMKHNEREKIIDEIEQIKMEQESQLSEYYIGTLKVIGEDSEGSSPEDSCNSCEESK